jgi:type II secretory pathway component GspD/PulD (secretin)
MKPFVSGRRLMKLAKITAALTLAFTLFVRIADAQAKPEASTPPDAKSEGKTYQTLYLTNITQQSDTNDFQTDLRNMLPQSRIYYVPTQSAISILGPPVEIALAQKILFDLDRPKKQYRVVYTITETDGGKRIGVQHLALIVATGGKTVLKQGSKVPVVIGANHAGSAEQSSQVQYLDVGLNIEASLDSYLDGVRLRTKVEQSSLAEEKSGLGMQDPVIRQTLLEGTSTLVQGKPLVLGSLDIPGSTRHQEIEVVSELVR